MARQTTNICSVCGKDRIILKTVKEYIGTSLVVTSITACPDPECQAKIDKQLAKEKKFRDEMKVAAERRFQEQKERRAANLRKPTL